MKFQYKYAVRLPDGRYIGNRISGPGGLHAFVPADHIQDACAFNSHRYAVEAANSYNLQTCAVEPFQYVY